MNEQEIKKLITKERESLRCMYAASHSDADYYGGEPERYEDTEIIREIVAKIKELEGLLP